MYPHPRTRPQPHGKLMLAPEEYAALKARGFTVEELRDLSRRGFMLPVMGGQTNGALAPAGLAAAAGGVDVAGSLVSVVPGIRKLKRIATSKNLPAAFKGGKIQLELPKSSYLHKAVIRVTGTLRIVQGGVQQTITATDPRTFLDRIEFKLSGSTQPRVLNGLQSDIIDELDVPAVDPNAQTYTAGPAGAASSTTDTTLALEWSPLFCVSDQNLFGIPYLGAVATVPEIVLSFKDPDGSLATKGAAGPTITLENGLVELELWRVDLPGPVMPQQHVQVVNGREETVTIPGQGLYLESSYVLLTRLHDAEDISAAGSYKKFKLPIGPDYLRVVALVYKNNALDDETAAITDRIELAVQQATVIESKKPWQFANEHRRLYNKSKPNGVYVFSGIDSVGTDADIYVSRELGNFDMDWYGSTVAPPANSRVECITQQLVPLSVPGQYL